MKFIIQIDNSPDDSLGKYSEIFGKFHFERDSIETAEKVFNEFKERFPDCSHIYFMVDTTVESGLTLRTFSGTFGGQNKKETI